MVVEAEIRRGPSSRERRPTRLLVLALYRSLLGALMITAILAQFGVSLAYWRRIGLRDVAGRAGDFFSAFTHDVNLAGGVVMLVGAVLLLRGRRAGPAWFTALRLALLASILVAGIVYNVLLRPQPVPAGSQLDWANEVMHVVAPAGVLIDWLVAPRRPRLPFRASLVVLVLPILWLAYTFVRGPLVPDELGGHPYFYPYDFLDPNGSGGWAPVLVLVAELMVFAVVLGLLAVLAWRLEDRLAGRSRTVPS
jgi:hypothetical protein